MPSRFQKASTRIHRPREAHMPQVCDTRPGHMIYFINKATMHGTATMAVPNHGGPARSSNRAGYQWGPRRDPPISLPRRPRNAYSKAAVRLHEAALLPGLECRRPQVTCYPMYPIDRSQINPFESATSGMRAAVLGLVDALPPEPPVPSVGSQAMSDLNEQAAFAHDGWGAEPIVDAHHYGYLQMFTVIDCAAAVAYLYESPRCFVVSPEFLLRPLAEATGRGKWLLDPTITTRERVGRMVNYRITDLTERKRLKIDSTRVQAKLASIYEAAGSLGYSMSRVRRGPKYVEPHPPSSSEFVRQGLAGIDEYRDTISKMLSMTLHGMWTGLHKSLSHGPPSLTPGVTWSERRSGAPGSHDGRMGAI